MSEPLTPEHLTAALLDAIGRFQADTRWNDLQHAQVRMYLAERLADTLLSGGPIADLLAKVERLRNSLKHLRDYHHKHLCDDDDSPEDCGCAEGRAESETGEVCSACLTPWPCLTVRQVGHALDGTA